MPRNAAEGSGFDSLEDAILMALDARGPWSATVEDLSVMMPMIQSRQMSNAANRLKAKGEVYGWTEGATAYFTSLRYQSDVLHHVEIPVQERLADLYEAFGMPRMIRMKRCPFDTTGSRCAATGGLILLRGDMTQHIQPDPIEND